jgi:hypothetical protein
MSQETKKVEEVKEQPNALVINMDLANAIGNYLSQRPYAEVKSIIAGLEASNTITLKERKAQTQKFEWIL